MPVPRPPSRAKVRLARVVFGLGWLAALAVLLTGPAYRFGYLDVAGIRTAFAFGASAALAAIIGGLALALLLPPRDRRSTLLATGLAWLFRGVVMAVFAVVLAFLASRVVPGLDTRADPQELLGLAGLGTIAAVVIGFLWAAAQPAGTSRPGLLATLMGIAMGVAAAWVPISWRIAADTLPRLNDITTDMAKPPGFVALPEPRATNGGDYPATFAAEQRAGYPDIRPLILKEPLPAAFARAEETARALGWQIVAADVEQGRIEAVDTTPWFAFKDDIVVRLTPVAGGTRIDMRSKSRVGISDLGANAARIRSFFARLQKAQP
jgi:uncharacterized protein (DUF1499 family)